MTKPISEFQKGRIVQLFDSVISRVERDLPVLSKSKVIVSNDYKAGTYTREQVVRDDQFRVTISMTVKRR